MSYPNPHIPGTLAQGLIVQNNKHLRKELDFSAHSNLPSVVKVKGFDPRLWPCVKFHRLSRSIH